MCNEKTMCNENQRMAFEEANRWLRYIDNFLWVISSFWMIGTGCVISKAFEWKGDNWLILVFGFATIFSWILYFLFRKNLVSKSWGFYKRLNDIEEKLEINIMPQDPDSEGKPFYVIMTVVAYLSMVVMFIFMLQFIYVEYH